MVGANHHQAIENHYLASLEKLVEVRLYNMHGQFQQFYHGATLNKLFFRLGFSKIVNRLNLELLKIVDDFQPEALFVFKGMEIYPRTLKRIKAKGVIITCYNPDHPTEHISRGSGNENVINSLPLYDHHFCYSKNIQQLLENTYQVPTSWLPFAFQFAKENKKSALAKRIAFIGNPDPERLELCHFLLKHSIPLALFGLSWKKQIAQEFLESDLCEIVDSTFDVDLAQKYLAHLNVFRAHNEGSHNLRTFEMPAIGCILLSPFSEEQVELFREDTEMLFYHNRQELLVKAKWLMSQDMTAIEKIRNQAYQRSIADNYSYDGRAKQVYQVIEKLVNSNRSI